MIKKDYKTERVTFMASEDLVKELEDFRFDKRIKSQGEAIRQLLEYALERKGKKR